MPAIKPAPLKYFPTAEAIPAAERMVMAIPAMVPHKERTTSPVLAVFSPRIRSRVSAFWANFRKAYPIRKVKMI